MNEVDLITKKLKGKKLKTSVSQIDSADPRSDGGCLRKWHFKSVLRLPQPPRTASTFGDVFHEVCERYLLADDFGNGPDGKPVNLYPEGWEESTNRWTGNKSGNPISEQEKSNTKKLIESAINGGVLARMPGREIEKELKHIILTHEGIDVELTGFIDLCEPESIIDHKTTSSKRWMKSINKLKKNTQLVTYAFVRWEQGEVDKDTKQWLRHNYYVVDKKTGALHVEKREVEISYADAKRFVNERVMPVIKMQVEALLVYKSYKEVPMATNENICTKVYGGCPYLKICRGKCSPEEYEKNINRMIENDSKDKYSQIANEIVIEKVKENKPTTGESQMMDLQAKIAAAKVAQGKVAGASAGATTPAATTPAPEPKPEPKPETTSAPATTDERSKAPWAQDEDCSMCANSPVKGIRDGKPCVLCKTKAKAKKGINTDDYTIEQIEGTIIIMDAAGDVALLHEDDAPVTVSEKSESSVEAEAKAADAQAKAEAEKAKADAEAQAKAEAELKAANEAEAAKAQAEADAAARKAAIEAEAAAATETPELNFEDERGKGKLLIGCSITDNCNTGRGKLGSPTLVISGMQLLESFKRYALDLPEIKQALVKVQGAKWEELNTFDRRDFIQMKGTEVAKMVGASTVQVADYPKGSDLEWLVTAIEPYMTVIRGIN